MAELVRVAEKNANFFPALINGCCLAMAASAAAFTIAAWQRGNSYHARLNAGLALITSSMAEFVNRQTKSEVAIAQLVIDAEARLIARNIQAQETTQAADLSVASGKRLAELNMDSAYIDAETAIRLAELEAEYQNKVAQIQEFIDLDKS
ncbi:MAG: hypothetical protein WBA13_14320 [Microcoleaceae cyanobacterium]